MAFLKVVVACMGIAGALGDQINVKTSPRSGQTNPGGVFVVAEGYANTKAVNQTYICMYPDSACSEWQKARCQVLAPVGKCEPFVGNTHYPTLAYKYTNVDDYTLNIDVYEDVKCGNEAQVRHLLESTNDMFTCPPIMGLSPPVFVQIEVSSEGNPGLDSGNTIAPVSASASISSSSAAPAVTPLATTTKSTAAATTSAPAEQKASSQNVENSSAAASAMPTIITLLVIVSSLACYVFM